MDSQSAEAWASKRGFGEMEQFVLRFMLVQDFVEEEGVALGSNPHEDERSRSYFEIPQVRTNRTRGVAQCLV